VKGETEGFYFAARFYHLGGRGKLTLFHVVVANHHINQDTRGGALPPLCPPWVGYPRPWLCCWTCS